MPDMPSFIPGLELNAAFSREIVGPLLDDAYPGLRHSAALIGYGSDVLGFDTERSTDHGWGPRLWLFLADDEHARYKDDVHEMLAQRLPLTFRGYPTGYYRHDGVGSLVPGRELAYPIAHEVVVSSLPGYVLRRLHCDPLAEMTARDWLLAPQQELLELTAGAIFHDGLGYLEPMRAALAWYPDDVWRAMLAAQWRRIEQEEAFVGRTGELGDELGSSVVAARLVRDVMRLCFLMERRYAPYSKWLGTAFARWLRSGPVLLPVLRAALAATDWHERERHLSAAYEHLAAMHNALGLTPPLEAKVSPFHGRPFRVIHGDRFHAALLATLPDDPVLREAAQIGAVDQFADSTDLQSYPARRRRVRDVYGG